MPNRNTTTLPTRPTKGVLVSDEPNTYVYTTDDTIDTVLTDNYFDGFGLQGDWSFMLARCSDGTFYIEVDGNGSVSKFDSSLSGGLGKANTPGTLSFAAVGDSITNQNITNRTLEGGGYLSSVGYVTWFLTYAMHKYNFLGTLSYSGSGTVAISEGLSELQNMSPDFVIVLSGTNDITGSSTLQEVYDAYDSIITQIRARNALPVFMTVFPNNLATDTENERIHNFNNHLRQRQQDGLIELVDISLQMRSDEYEMASDVNSDNVHPNARGANRMGYELFKTFNTLFPHSVNILPDDDTNLWPNKFFTGTGGTLLNSVTGETVDGSYITKTANCTCAASVEKLEGEARNSVVCDIDVTADNQEIQLFWTQQSLTAGEYYLTADIEVFGDVNLKMFNVRHQSFTDDTYERFSSHSGATVDNEITLQTPYTLRQKIINFTTTGTSSCGFYLEAFLGIGSGKIAFKNPRLIKVS